MIHVHAVLERNIKNVVVNNKVSQVFVVDKEIHDDIMENVLKTR